ncbi:MAG: alpha/beta hydrolase family protein [Phycisphaerae bacterium]|nr:prolyl oligopeptidase family serine peptidase [Tepidisphaeraceae bacterium]
MTHRALSIAALLCSSSVLAAEGWQADSKVVADLEKKRSGVMYREEGVPKYTLPDPLARADGSKIATAKEWEAGERQRTLDLFATHVFGKTPARPAAMKFEVLLDDPKAMEGKATHKRVKITSTDAAGKSYAFEASLMLPNGAKGPVPAFVLINNRPVASADPTRGEKNGFWPAEEIVARGFATAVFRTWDVDPDEKGDAARAKGVRGVWPDGGGKVADGDAWATIGAWAWGASRVMDWLETVPAVDAKRVAVIGHSRGGKTALWAGAQDVRFSVAISSCSGEGGASLSRRRLGERVAHLNKSFPFWFCGNYKKFDDKEDALPVDHHQLVALMAPRAVAIGSADTDLWADPRGEFLAVAHAGPVFALYGQPTVAPAEMPALESPLNRGKLHYHVRKGGHNLLPQDWGYYMDFAETVWK